MVEDDEALNEFLVELLIEHRYMVHSARTGTAGRTLFYRVEPDLVVLDLTLPDIDGESLCIEFKKEYPHIPVLILTAKDNPQTLVRNLEKGADDYIAKPFLSEELIARIQARLRDKGSFDPVLKAGDLMVNTETFDAIRVWATEPDVETRVVDVYIGYLRKKIDTGFDKKLICSKRGFGYMVKE